MNDVSLGRLDDLPPDAPALRKVGDQRLVCIRRKDRVDVLDDRCPHEGYPLSQGTVQGGTLTCCWHNWKFDCETGACLFGGEGVRRYASRIVGGEVRVDLTIDPALEEGRLRGSLEQGLWDSSLGSVMRDGLRLEALTGSMDAAFSVLLGDATRRARYGFDHGLALLADLISWVEDGLVRPSDAFAAASLWVAEPLTYLPAREVPEPQAGSLSELREALAAEERERAEAIARHVAHEGRGEELLAQVILPWLAMDLAEYGHGAIYAFKALQLSTRAPELAPDIWGSLIHSLSWATIESALPGWGVTHRAIREVDETGSRRSVAPLDPGFVDTLLHSEKVAVGACLEQLRAGVDPIAILEASALAAATRITRFDDRWERSHRAPVTILDVSHTLTFTEAALSLSPHMEEQARARFAIQAAGFIGKLKDADREQSDLDQELPRQVPRGSTSSSFANALGARDLRSAVVHSLDADYFATATQFAMNEACVRPIFAAHAIKTTESARRLEARLSASDATRLRAAALTVMVPQRPERFIERTRTVAERFLAEGKPPPGLY